MRNQAPSSQPIRDLKGFFASYLKSDSAKRALTRAPQLVEKEALDSHRRVIKWKEPQGYNTLALAFAGAFNV